MRERACRGPIAPPCMHAAARSPCLAVVQQITERLRLRRSLRHLGGTGGEAGQLVPVEREGGGFGSRQEVSRRSRVPPPPPPASTAVQQHAGPLQTPNPDLQPCSPACSHAMQPCMQPRMQPRMRRARTCSDRRARCRSRGGRQTRSPAAGPSRAWGSRRQT